MKIKVTSKYGSGDEETTLEQLVDHACDGSGYDSGELESMSSSINKQTRLLNKIVEKLNLSNEEINEWFGVWGKTFEKIEE